MSISYERHGRESDIFQHELKKRLLPHLVDPSIPPPDYWFEKSDNQKRKEARAKKLAEKEAREAERLEEETKVVLERKKAAALNQSPHRIPSHPQHAQPQHDQAPQMIQYYIPISSNRTTTPPRAGQSSNPSSQAQGLGYGRPPLSGRSATSSRISSAGRASTRIVSNSSIASIASSSTVYSVHSQDYRSDTEDPSPGRLKRTKTMPAASSARPGPSSRMDYGMPRDFSTASNSSMYSVPGSSQESWSSWRSDDRMDDN